MTSRRLRKKLYLEEFAIFGVELECALTCKDEADLEQVMGDFVGYIDTLNLHISGGGDLTSFAGFISSHDRYGSVTDADRESIDTWLKGQKVVSSFDMSELVDANYG